MRVVIDTAVIWRGLKTEIRRYFPGVCGGYFNGTSLRHCGDEADAARGFCSRCLREQRKARDKQS